MQIAQILSDLTSLRACVGCSTEMLPDVAAHSTHLTIFILLEQTGP